MLLASEAELVVVQWPTWVRFLVFGLPTIIAAIVLVIVLLRERRKRSRP
jgi:hypothetical protein